MGKLEDALKVLATAKDYILKKTGRSEAIVFYSGGKDARTVLDLAVRTFDRVVPVAMYFLPGLECFEQAIDDARTRYGLQILQYPHWANSAKFKSDPPIYRPPMPPEARALIPDLGLRDIFNMCIADTGIPLILDGAKASDGLWRRRTLKAVQYAEVFHPIESWLKVDVLSYLAAHSIPLPDASDAAVAGGVGLGTRNLLWMHDKYPNDFKRVCEVFPFAEAVVWRRRYFGVCA